MAVLLVVAAAGGFYWLRHNAGGTHAFAPLPAPMKVAITPSTARAASIPAAGPAP
jgi:hypothetical protein